MILSLCRRVIVWETLCRISPQVLSGPGEGDGEVVQNQSVKMKIKVYPWFYTPRQEGYCADAVTGRTSEGRGTSVLSANVLMVPYNLLILHLGRTLELKVQQILRTNNFI